MLPLLLVLGPPATCVLAANPDPFFDHERYRLIREDGRYRLQSATGTLEVPLDWLEPPEVVREDRESYVGSLDWDEQVTSFPIGAGRLGLHLSSYSIADGGSAQAAAGRDLFLILDPATGTLSRGLDPGLSKSRVNVGGCWEARFVHFAVGDVDCDRRLDLAVITETMTCELGHEPSPDGGRDSLRRPHHRLGPRQWYLGTGQAWVHESAFDDRLPCAGMRAVPLIGLVKGPIEYLLERYDSGSPLIDASGAPVSSKRAETSPP
jgi:hypothetical protein